MEAEVERPLGGVACVTVLSTGPRGMGVLSTGLEARVMAVSGLKAGGSATEAPASAVEEAGWWAVALAFAGGLPLFLTAGVGVATELGGAGVTLVCRCERRLAGMRNSDWMCSTVRRIYLSGNKLVVRWRCTFYFGETNKQIYIQGGGQIGWERICVASRLHSKPNCW